MTIFVAVERRKKVQSRASCRGRRVDNPGTSAIRAPIPAVTGSAGIPPPTKVHKGQLNNGQRLRCSELRQCRRPIPFIPGPPHTTIVTNLVRAGAAHSHCPRTADRNDCIFFSLAQSSFEHLISHSEIGFRLAG
jgi:hypothetical protein